MKSEHKSNEKKKKGERKQQLQTRRCVNALSGSAYGNTHTHTQKDVQCLPSSIILCAG